MDTIKVPKEQGKSIFDLCDEIAPYLMRFEYVNYAIIRGQNTLDDDELRRVIALLKADGLLVTRANNSELSDFTSEGRFFFLRGGFKEKLIRDKKREDLINDQIQSTIDTNKTVKKVSAWNVRLFWVTLVIAIGTIAVPAVTLFNNEAEISRLRQVNAQKEQEIQRLQKPVPAPIRSPIK